MPDVEVLRLMLRTVLASPSPGALLADIDALIALLRATLCDADYTLVLVAALSAFNPAFKASMEPEGNVAAA